MKHRRALVGLVVAAVGVVAPVVGTSPAAAAAPGVAPSGPTVTLLTGDTVTVGGVHGVSVRAARGREHVTFYTRRDVRGNTHVVPEDALDLVAQRRLDPRLFDVTELVRMGYDDASRDRLPLIVDFAGPTPRSSVAQVRRELPAMSAAAVSVERSGDFWAAARTAEHVWLDGQVRVSLDQSVRQIGAPDAWAAGHTGDGTTVAVLDTGIDVTHPDLADAVVGAANFSASDTIDDWHGHGTLVSSIITGNGEKYRGVAPDTKLLNGKVLGDNGGGFSSEIIAGMEWAVANGADVVNMSLGARGPSHGTDPMDEAVNRLTAETGILFVVAAGNRPEFVGSPAAADAALTVGAVDREERLADFSSRGRVDGAIKPDITAPGVGIVGAKAANAVIGDPAGDGYISESGTSLAAPHVAGAAAILAGQHPGWTAEQLKAALMSTARPNGTSTVFEEGAGRVDVAKVSGPTVVASVGSLSLGTAQWPHHDDQPITKTITYTNLGGEPVTLDVAADVTGPNGSRAPQGMFTVEPAQLTVQAGGQVTTTVTVDTKVDAADGVYSGAITAGPVRTPITVNREIESYDVTLTGIGHSGTPTDLFFPRFVNVDNAKEYQLWDPSGTVSVRLPKGEYFLDAPVLEQVDEFDRRNAEFVEPAFLVTGDTDLVLDAREAKPVTFRLAKPNARPGKTVMTATRETAWGSTGFSTYLPDGTGTVKPSATRHDAFTLTVDAHLAEWNGTSFDGSPYLYHVRHKETGGVPDNLTWTYRDRQFATVRTVHAAMVPGGTGQREDFLTIPLPSTLTEYYTPDVPWDGVFSETTAEGEYVAGALQIVPRTFTRGRTTTDRWNMGVFAPAFPTLAEKYYLAARQGDRLGFNLRMDTDQVRGRYGVSAGVGTTTLLRDGELVGEQPTTEGAIFDVGPEPAEYTLRATLDRSGLARLSTQVSSEWTFPSAHVPGNTPIDMPFPALRFAPDLDGHNAAPAGKRFTIPVFVERNMSETGQVRTLAVEVSYDDGATWQPTKVRHDKVTVDHPAGAEFVSLRSNLTTADGYAQHLTIIRAYALA